MSYQKEAQGQTQDLLERLHLSAAFGVGGGGGSLGFSAETGAPTTRAQKTGRKWRDGI